VLPPEIRDILDAKSHDEIVELATVLLGAGPAQEGP
jgi:hypothetical protein